MVSAQHPRAPEKSHQVLKHEVLKIGRRPPIRHRKEATMSSPLFVLILEDDLADFELIAHELARFGFTARCERVETEADFAVRLQERPDIILADYSLAGFGNLRALEILHESGLVIPFIVLTGAVSEDQVVECMKKGAADYLLKDRILRLGPAVQRALEEGELRRQKIAADQALRRKNLELEEQYRRAQAASRMKSIFLANMSHELRSPLTAVIGFAELLVDGRVGALTAEQLDFTQDILANGKHLLSLVNDVLDLARVESGTMTFHPERICLPDLIRETIAGFRLLASERNITLATDVQMSAIEIFLDPQKLRQVLLNYVSNALKFTPAGGRVTVHARFEAGSTFRLEVEDTGIGIAPQDIGRLFQDFHQLDGGLSKEVQGTGLGLALTKRLVEAQGGKVGVVSYPGKGSRFFADLPCSADSSQSDLGRLSKATTAKPVPAYSAAESQTVPAT
jgi:signal transduction histidine kinase